MKRMIIRRTAASPPHQIQIRVPKPLWKKLERRCKTEHLSYNYAIATAIALYVDEAKAGTVEPDSTAVA